ncbi:MAG TPA: hypothetical protein VGA51_20160 [Casimicrobiaceae bacterium]
MTMLCDTCNSNGRARAALARLLRRGAVSVAIVAALIAIVLGESWVIERAPQLFAARVPAATAGHARGPAAAPAADVLPIAILH